MNSHLDPAGLEPAPENSSPCRRRALVVDDDHYLCEMVSEVLRDAGWETRKAGDGRQAVQALELHPSEVLVIDLVMPDQEGLETIRHVRARWPEIRIIAISGAGPDVYLRIAHLLGAHATLRKPFGLNHLLELLDPVAETYH